MSRQMIKHSVIYVAVAAMLVAFKAIPAQSNEPAFVPYTPIVYDSNETDRPAGFIGLRPICLPEEGLSENDKRIVKAVKEIIDVLSEGKNVTDVLNGCNRYSSDVFGKTTSDGSTDKSEEPSQGFFGIKVVQDFGHRSVSLKLPKNPKDIILLNESGFIDVRGESFDQDRFRQSLLYPAVRKDGTCLNEESTSALTKDNFTVWRGDEVSYIRIFYYETKTCLSLTFYRNGMLNALCWLPCDYDPERTTAYKSVLPNVVQTGVLKRSFWKEDGNVSEFQDAPKEFPLVFETPVKFFASPMIQKSKTEENAQNNKGFKIPLRKKADKSADNPRASIAEVDASAGGGFLGITPIVPPKDFLDENEKGVVKALANVTLALSRGKNVEQILNESDPFSDVLFGNGGEIDEQHPLGFLGLDVERRKDVEIDDDCTQASADIFLLAEKGFIKLSRHSSLAKLAPDFAQSADEGVFGDDDTYYIELYQYDRKSGAALQATKSGRVLNLYRFEFLCDNTTDFESYKFHFPEFEPTKLTDRKISWDEKGNRGEEN